MACKIHYLILLYRKKATDALWFAETYRLMPQTLQLRDKDGSIHEVNVSLTATNSAESPSSEGAGHGKHAESCKGEGASTITQNLIQNNKIIQSGNHIK